MIQTKGLTGAQSMLRVLGKMGVEKIFASPGSEWSPLWEALAEPGVEGMPQYYSTRHEEIAVGMASGYAKSTMGKLPAVVIHTTVGAFTPPWRCAQRCTSRCRWWCSPVSLSVSAKMKDRTSAVNGRATWATWAGRPSWSITRSNGASASIPSRSFRPPCSAPAAWPWRVRAGRCSCPCRWNICSIP